MPRPTSPKPDRDNSPPPPQEPIDRAPSTPDELHAWLRRVLDVHVVRTPLLRGHQAPFDYLAHAFLERDAPPDCVVWAARGSGKTFLGALASALDLFFKPGIEVRVLAGSFEQARRMHAHLRRLFRHPILADALEGPVTERRVRLSNGSELELLSHSHASVRGTRVQKLRCDEVELFHPEVWEAAQLVTRSKQCGPFHVRGSVECLSTMHRPHGLMNRLVGECREGTRRLFRWGVVDCLEPCPPRRHCRAADGPADDASEDAGPAADCPLLPECGGRAKHRSDADSPGHVSIDDAIAMKRRVAATTWDAEMLCVRPSRSDAVYPEFDPSAHIVDALPFPIDDPGLSWAAGMDFGYRAPTAILLGVVDARGVLWIVAERVRREVVLDDHVRALAGALAEGGPPIARRPQWVGVDPAGRQRSDQTGRSACDVLRAAGFAVRDRALRQRVGIGLVRARLRPACGREGESAPTPRLFIHARCTTLIACLQSYHYDPERPERDDPVKDGTFDHACDALRYLVQSLDKPGKVAQRNYNEP